MAKEIDLSFEQAMEKLETITRKLESGTLPLDESISAFEEGTALVRYCQNILDSYEAKLNEITGGKENE